MSNSGSNKKDPGKKSSNSYSLLLKGLTEVEKKKPKTASSSKKAKDNSSHSLESHDNNSMTSRNEYSDNPSPSNDKTEDVQHPDVPDRSFGDYFCKLCDSHMNSDAMWEAHITGKRHIKNVSKGDTESKYEDLPDVESSIKHEIRNVKEPVVGLSYIHEIRRKEPNVPPIYNCFLCHASIATVPLVIEHVISMKHRLNYIKENNPEEYQLIEATNLKKGHMEPLVLEAARQMEQKVGRGTVKVKQEKKNPATTWVPHKRPYNLNDDYFDKYQKPHSKNANYEELGPRPDIWKSIQPTSIPEFQDRYRAPRDFREDFMPRSRSRSPNDYRGRTRMYSGDDSSLDGYKRSYSSRNLSPSPPRDMYEKRSYSKRAVSPTDDYHSFRNRTDDYLPSSRKSDSRDRLDYIRTRYETTDPRESMGISYPSINQSFQKSDSCLRSVDSPPAPPVAASGPSKPKSIQDVVEYASLLSNEECLNLCHLILRALPEVSTLNEMVTLMRIITDAQKKLKSKLNEDMVAALLNLQKGGNPNTTNVIPGLDGMSSVANLHNRAANSQNASNAERFLNDLFNKTFSSKTATAQLPIPTSYAPTINSPSAALGNTYQAGPASYQAPPTGNTYQGTSMNPIHNQAPYPFPNTNLPFAPGSAPNVRGLNFANNANPQPQTFNYSHFPSTSNSRNFPPSKY